MKEFIPRYQLAGFLASLLLALQLGSPPRPWPPGSSRW